MGTEVANTPSRNRIEASTSTVDPTGCLAQSAEQIRTHGRKSRPVDPARLFSIVLASGAAFGKAGRCAGRGPGSPPPLQPPLVATRPSRSHPRARGRLGAEPKASSGGGVGQRPKNSTLWALEGITQQLPSVEPAQERSDFVNPSLLQLQRHPGAGHLVGSSAVQNHFLTARDLEMPQLHFFRKDSQRARDTLRFSIDLAAMAQVHYNDFLPIIQLLF